MFVGASAVVCGVAQVEQRGAGSLEATSFRREQVCRGAFLAPIPVRREVPRRSGSVVMQYSFGDNVRGLEELSPSQQKAFVAMFQDEKFLLKLSERELASDFKCIFLVKCKGNFGVPNSHFPELFRARSRLYRSQILQVKTRWKALAEIYTMHSFAPFFNLNFFVKNC